MEKIRLTAEQAGLLDEIRRKYFAVEAPASSEAAVPEGYVDLGLPSGTLWADQNADGYYTHDEAVAKFGDSLPKPQELVELYFECNWTWDEARKGYQVEGKNGNSIFLPASGYRDRASGGLGLVGSYGSYWSSADNSAANAYYLYFYSGLVYPLYYNRRAVGFAVRPVRRII